MQTDAASPQAEHTPVAKPGLVLALVMVGTFLAPLDGSIVNIALPDIAAEFGAPLTAVAWVASGYLLTNAALVLTMGRLGDIWGLRRVYATGFILFGAGSLACALSPSLTLLIAARVAQAVGASMMFAAGPAIITNTFPPGKRGRALGAIGMAVSAGLMLGPSLGGVLIGAFGWPAIFLVNVPLALLVAAGSLVVLPPDEPEHGATFDIGGAALAAVALLSLMLALSWGRAFGWSSPRVLGLLALSLIAGAAFVALERRLEQPMLDLSLLENWAFSAGSLAAVLTYASTASLTFLLPFYLLKAHGIAPETAGLLLAVPSAVMAFGAPLAGRLSDSLGSRGIASVGLCVVAAGFLAFSSLDPDSSLWLIVLFSAAMGAGAAMFGAPNTSAVLSETPRSRRGIGSAVIADARNIGMALGIAVASAIVTSALPDPDILSASGVLGGADSQHFMAAFAVALRTAAAIALLGAVVSWSRGWRLRDSGGR